MRIEELMTRDLVVIAPDADLRDVATTFLAHGISGAPVCDAENRVLGVISKADIVAKERGLEHHRHAFIRWVKLAGGTTKVEATTARDAMTQPAITVPSYVSAAGAAQLMLEKGFHRLPVVDQGKLVGIVTQTDLVRAFARADEEIAREIHEELRWQFPELPAAEHARPSIEVAGGAVVVQGELERRSDVDAIQHVIRRVPGVVSITLNVTWKIDDAESTYAAPFSNS